MNQTTPKPTSPPPQPKINVAQHLVRLAASCMATHDIRYYLNGIYIEPRQAGGVFIVAADGARMLVVVDETGQADQPAILRLSRGTVQRMARPCASGGAAYGKRTAVADETADAYRLQTEVIRGKTAAVLTDYAGQLLHVDPDVLVQGNFPDWRRVMPAFDKLTPGTAAEYRHSYVQDVLATFARGSRTWQTAIAWTQPNEGAAIVFQLPRHEHACLLVMPMRGDGHGRGELFFKAWGDPNARLARRPADPQADPTVAVPAERGAGQEERPAEAGAQPAAAGPEAQAPAQSPVS